MSIIAPEHGIATIRVNATQRVLTTDCTPHLSSVSSHIKEMHFARITSSQDVVPSTRNGNDAVYGSDR